MGTLVIFRPVSRAIAQIRRINAFCKIDRFREHDQAFDRVIIHFQAEDGQLGKVDSQVKHNDVREPRTRSSPYDIHAIIYPLLRPPSPG